MNLPKDLRVLTVKQPWAGLIIDGVKDVENRSWPFPSTLSLPCTIAIHAGAKLDPISTADWMLRSVVLGVVDVIGCHKRETTGAKCHRCDSPWGSEDQHHWMLANPVKFAKPIPARGRLGLSSVDPDILTLIRRALDL